jgi:uncharacterized protein (TIGR03435 family)
MAFRVTAGLCSLWAIISVGSSTGQTVEPSYKYEVVSIHKSPPGQPNSGFSPGPQGGLRARNVTAMQLLTFAWGARDYQFLRAPDWMKSERFEISLTPDRSDTVPGPDVTRVQIESWLHRNRQRVQAVLRDRFDLVLRAETRKLPVYSLRVAKNGPKLTPPQDSHQGPSFDINGSEQIIAKSSTMKMLTDGLSVLLGRFVRDVLLTTPVGPL